MVNEFVTFQIAAICGLVGMTLGWRGVMTKYSGFYDLPTAWNQVFWGILLGGAYASTAHNWLFIPYLETGTSGERAGELNLINLILITLITTIAMHFLLRRKRIRKGGSHATSGWGLGLAVGGMFSIVLIMYKVMAGVNGVTSVLTIALIAFFAPRAEALITSYHGVLMLRGKRWGAIFRATFWRAASITMFYFAWLDLLAWIFIIPPILLVQDSAERWVWNSVPKEGQRRWRRMQADKKREKQAAARDDEAPKDIGTAEE